MLNRIVVRGAVLLSLSGVALFACSLGLDASKLNVGTEAGTDATLDVDTPDAPVIPPPDLPCRNDTECPAQGCFVPRCLGERCKYELCPTGQGCSHSACVANTCVNPPVKHAFAAARMVLGKTGLGCGGRFADCVSVVYPFAFVGHKSSLAFAYPLVDFAAAADGGEIAPLGVKLNGLDFVVARTVSSGRRVWFIGDATPRAAELIVPVAWLDVPANPGVQEMTARSSSVVVPPGTSLGAAFPGADEGIIVFLSQPPGSPLRATQFKVDPEAGTIPLAPAFHLVPLPDGGVETVVSSGDRLVTGRSEGTIPLASYRVDIIVGAGSAGPKPIGERTLSNLDHVYPGARFVSTPQGAVIVHAAHARVEDGGVLGWEGTRIAWFLKEADDTIPNADPRVDVVTFDPDGGLLPGPTAEAVGPLAAVGENQVVALQSADDAGTYVRAVRRTGAVGQIDPGSFAILPQPPGAFLVFGAVSENTGKSYAYAVSTPLNDGDGYHVQAFELGCGQ